MKTLVFFIGFLLLIPQLSLSQWIQQGTDINGEAPDNLSGRSVSLSADGNRIAIGAIGNNNDNGIESGHVRVYELQGETWIQLGNDIDGEAAEDHSGRYVSLSADGNRVAIGADDNDGNGNASGHVRIYEFDGLDWIQLGADIDGEAADDRSGLFLSLAANGNRVAVAAPWNDGNGNLSGQVRVFEFDGANWIQLGADLDGGPMDFFGSSVSFSYNGNRLAVGASLNDDNGNNSGHVRVFEFDGANWVQSGPDIGGEAAGDGCGRSVSFNSDGNILAIGADGNAANGAEAGHVRIFEFDGVNWIQLGTDIDGEAAGDWFGRVVSLNGKGDIVVAGAINNAGNGAHSGHARVYRYNGVDWVQFGSDIDGENPGDSSGYAVSLSNDGHRVAIGATQNDGHGHASGHVRVFNFLYTAVPDTNFEQALIDQGIDSESILDGQVPTLDIAGITNLDISGEQISDLSGIEDFTALEVLNFNNNRLAAVNLSNNINLQELYCGSNRLDALDVSNNPDLSVLYCVRNRITGLSLNVNINLSFLHCNNNVITGRLDLRNLALLVEVNTIGNPDLGCIQVNDPAAADAGMGIYANWVKDPGAIYSENCSGIMAKGDIASVVKDIKEKGAIQTIIVYPNPARDQLHIASGNEAAITHVVFYNLQGERVLESKTADINISSLAEGLYFMAIRTLNNEPVIYRKIVVSKE